MSEFILCPGEINKELYRVDTTTVHDPHSHSNGGSVKIVPREVEISVGPQPRQKFTINIVLYLYISIVKCSLTCFVLIETIIGIGEEPCL